MRIVVDAMGSDHHPVPDVAGAVMAAKETGLTIILVGDQARIHTELNKHDLSGTAIEVVHTDQAVAMTDKPGTVGKTKPRSSMRVGMDLVKSGEADAFVTAGNTGAAHAIATLHSLRRIQGIRRPALSAIFPFWNKPVFLLDIGANADVKPEWMVQFAIMGHIWAKNVHKIERPSIGLLANGEEEGKGNQLILDTTKMLQQLPFLNFCGNVEPKQVMQAAVDVVVSDGFSGNILMKTFEASARYISSLIREEIKNDPLSLVGGVLSRPAYKRVRARTDTSEVGGVPLLGLNGVVIIAHGSADAKAVKNAIKQAQRAVEGRVVEAIREGLKAIPAFEAEAEE